MARSSHSSKKPHKNPHSKPQMQLTKQAFAQTKPKLAQILPEFINRWYIRAYCNDLNTLPPEELSSKRAVHDLWNGQKTTPRAVAHPTTAHQTTQLTKTSFPKEKKSFGKQAAFTASPNYHPTPRFGIPKSLKKRTKSQKQPHKDPSYHPVPHFGCHLAGITSPSCSQTVHDKPKINIRVPFRQFIHGLPWCAVFGLVLHAMSSSFPWGLSYHPFPYSIPAQLFKKSIFDVFFTSKIDF